MELRKELGEQYFEKNFMCNPKAEPEGAIFSVARMLDCFDRNLTFSQEHEGPTFIGCDFAISSGSRADFDAYVVVEKKDGFFVIKHIETHKGMPAPMKVRRIKELADLYEPLSVIVDESNLGSILVDELRAKALPVVPQGFHSKERKNLLTSLKNVLDGKKLVIPRSPSDPDSIDITNTLVEQLTGFKEEKSKTTGINSIMSTASHDDIAMALAMAVKEASEMQSASIGGTW